jgi:quercetin dioxygenase-like cupin family protein
MIWGMARPFAVALIALAALALAQTPPTSAYGNAPATLDKDPTTALVKFAESDSCTVNFLAAKTPVRPHYHAKHEETVVVLRGAGTFKLGKEEHKVRPGDTMHIVRGTVHSFTPISEDVVVVSVFSPKFDGQDRVFVDGG